VAALSVESPRVAVDSKQLRGLTSCNVAFANKGGYARFEDEIEVQRGYRKDLKVRLEKGESQPPGVRPGK
jgi:hypothetical protein